MKQFIKDHKKYLLIGFGIVLLSVILRFWKLGNIPIGLYWDEVAMYVDAKTISQNGLDMHGNSAFQAILPSYGDYKLPVYIWLASFSFKLLGASEFHLRLPSALAGIAQGFLVFFFLRYLSKQKFSEKMSYGISFLGWFVVTTAPWSVLFSRTAFEGHIGQFLVSVSVYALFLSKKSKWWLILSVLAGVISVYSYYSVRFVWPVLFISYLCLFWISTANFKLSIKNIIMYLSCLVIWGICLMPIFWSQHYPASQQFRLSTSSLLDLAPYSTESKIYKEMAGNTYLSKFFYHQRILQLKDLCKHYSDHLTFNYLFMSGDQNLRHGTGNHGLFLLSTLPLLVAGCMYLLRKNWKVCIFLIIWWLIALFPASVPIETPHALRSLNALTPIILLMSFGGVPLYTLFLNIRSAPARKIIQIAIISFAIIDIAWFGLDYFFIYPQKSGGYWQEQYKQLAEIIDKNQEKYVRIWVNPQDDRFFLWYLAFSKLDAPAIQSVMKDTFLLKEIDNIIFRESAFDRKDDRFFPLMTITQDKETINPPDSEEIILDSNGKPLFAVRIYEK